MLQLYPNNAGQCRFVQNCRKIGVLVINVSLYSADQMNHGTWDKGPYSDYARRYLVPVAQEPGKYIKNVFSPLRVALVDQCPIPFTPVRSNPENSYVAAPFNHYILYGIEELSELGQPRVERFLAWLLTQIGRYCQRGELDNAILINNWFLSTNLYPELSQPQIGALHQALLDAYPEQALIWRSVDLRGGRRLYEHLLALGYMPVFSRHVWYQDPAAKKTTQRNNYKNDLRLMRKTGYEVVPAQALDPDRVVDLYNQLYIGKYSTFNPQFTPAFIRLALENRLLELSGFAKNGVLDAVLGYVIRGGLMTPPIFGYEFDVPRTEGLYRLISTRFSQEALRLGKMAHFSAGVGPFKSARGAEGVVEYNMVYAKHLPAYRRRPWQLLKLLLDYLAIPIITSRGL